MTHGRKPSRVDSVVEGLEAIRRVGWGDPERLADLGLLADPAIDILAAESQDPVERVAALRALLVDVAAEMAEQELPGARRERRSDAAAARILLRLDPEHEEANVRELQEAIAAQWTKWNAKLERTEPLSPEGFRKHQQGALYARLGRFVRRRLDLVLAESGRGRALRVDLLSAWGELVDEMMELAASPDGIPEKLTDLANALDQPIRRRLELEDDPAKSLTTGVLDYGRQLHDEGRDSALISFRSNLSLTLHIIGEHEARVELGELALESAEILDNALARVEILVDDLGWGNYMRERNRPEVALECIDAAEKLATAELHGDPQRVPDFTMVVAKAIRHRSLIFAEQHGVDATDDLAPAHAMLEELEPSDVVRREIGQILHARALIPAICRGIDADDVKPGAREKPELAKALEDARDAAKIFQELGDQARYTKALYLEYRLLTACGERVEARRVKAVRDRALAASAWSRPERVTTLDRV